MENLYFFVFMVAIIGMLWKTGGDGLAGLSAIVLAAVYAVVALVL